MDGESVKKYVRFVATEDDVRKADEMAETLKISRSAFFRVVIRALYKIYIEGRDLKEEEMIDIFEEAL